MVSLTTATNQIAKYVTRFIQGDDHNGWFTIHIKRNALPKSLMWLFGVAYAVIILATRILPHDSYDKILQDTWSNLFIYRYFDLYKPLPFFFQAPFHVFALYSIISGWSTYNNYILVVHSRVVTWAIKWFVTASIAL